MTKYYYFFELYLYVFSKNQKSCSSVLYRCLLLEAPLVKMTNSIVFSCSICNIYACLFVIFFIEITFFARIFRLNFLYLIYLTINLYNFLNGHFFVPKYILFVTLTLHNFIMVII